MGGFMNDLPDLKVGITQTAITRIEKMVSRIIEEENGGNRDEILQRGSFWRRLIDTDWDVEETEDPPCKSAQGDGD
jgi:hypothetical protein